MKYSISQGFPFSVWGGDWCDFEHMKHLSALPSPQSTQYLRADALLWTKELFKTYLISWQSSVQSMILEVLKIHILMDSMEEKDKLHKFNKTGKY